MNITDLKIIGDEPLQLLLGDEDRAELEDVCKQTQQFMSILLKPFAERHPELVLKIEPAIQVDLAQSSVVA